MPLVHRAHWHESRKIPGSSTNCLHRLRPRRWGRIVGHILSASKTYGIGGTLDPADPVRADRAAPDYAALDKSPFGAVDTPPEQFPSSPDHSLRLDDSLPAQLQFPPAKGPWRRALSPRPEHTF